MVELAAHQSPCRVDGAVECSTAACSAESGGRWAEHSASPLAAPGSVCSSRSSWRWAPPTGARGPQPALPLLHRAGLPCCISPGPRARLRRSSCAPATAAPQLCCPRRQLQVSPGRGAPRGRSLPGQPLWRLMREVRADRPTPWTSCGRCAQRVSRAAGICLPAAAGCQRSSARCCRQSAARCRRPGRRSSSPTTRHPRTWRTPNRLMALGPR